MGNRALIMFEGQGVGIYLHWNGGRDSVQPFLDYCKLKGFRPDDYGVARMAQVVGNFMGGTLSLGVQCTKGLRKADLDPGDNGIYIVKNWEIIGRYPEDVTEQNNYSRLDFMLAIDQKQPESERIGGVEIRKYLHEIGA